MSAVSISTQAPQRLTPKGRARRSAAPLADEAIDWTQVSLSELADHMTSVHHAALREVLPDLIARTAGLADTVPAHAEAVRRLSELLAGLMLHMKKLEQLIYPLLRRLEAGKPGVYLLDRLLAPEALALDADVAAAHEALAALRVLARHCPDPQTLDVARKLDDRARRFLRLEADVLLPRARALGA
jgi:iron-sulfur cluster repair protein YtfE (RIC family)